MLKKLNLKSKTFAENLIKYVLVARFFALSIPYRVYKKATDFGTFFWERDKELFFLKLYEFTFFFNEKYDKLIKIYGEDIKDLREINTMMAKFFKEYFKNSKFMSEDHVTLIQHPAVKRVYHKALRDAKKFLRDEDESVIDVTRQILNVYLRAQVKGRITKESLAKIKNGNKIKDQLNELLSTKVKYWVLSIVEDKLTGKDDKMYSVHANLFCIMSLIRVFVESDLNSILYTGKGSHKQLEDLIDKIENDIYNYCAYSLTKRLFGQLKNFGYSYEDDVSDTDKKRAKQWNDEISDKYVKIERHLDDEDFKYDVDEDEEDQDYEDDDSDYENEESDYEDNESEDEEDSEDEDSDYEDDEDDSDYEDEEEDDEDDSDDNESVESLANKIKKSAFAKRLLKLACIKKFVAANHIAQPKYLILMISIMFSAFLYQQQHNGENGYTDKMLKTLDECAPKIAKRPNKSVIEKVFKFFAENLNDIIISMKDSI